MSRSCPGHVEERKEPVNTVKTMKSAKRGAQRRSPVRSTTRIAARLGAIGAGIALVGGLTLAPTALAATQAGQPYTDVANNPDLAAITFLTAEGVLNGYPNHTFLPGNTITRAEFTAAVVRLLGPKAAASANALANITPSFTDAASIPTWAWGYINYAQGQKLINGFPDGTFQANAPVTMVQAAAILVRAIGDTPTVTSTSWPSNYTVAAYNLNLTGGVTFSANLPATRGEVAQMAYDAALFAPTLQNGYTAGSPTGAPLYLGGNGLAQTAWVGTVSGATSSSISLTNAQGQSVLSAQLASNYYLLGASSVTTLQGEQVVVVENANGHVDFIQVTGSQSTHTATLASSTVATPSGYTRVNDWTVQSGSSYSLLLSDGTLVPIVSPNSGGGTNYYLNAPSAGVGTDTHDLVAGSSALADGEGITYVLNSAGQAITVYATGSTVPLGLVSAVNTTNNTLTYTSGSNDGTTGTATVQPWTSVTLNGASSSLASLQPGDVVSVDLVGGGNGGDTNASAIAATRQTVSGTITSLTNQSNGTSVTTTLGLTESGGQTTQVAEDSSFDSHGVPLNVGSPVTLILDAQGQARAAEAAVGQQTVVLVEGTQQSTQETSSGGVQTVNQIVVDNGGQKQTYNLTSGTAMPPQPGASGYLAVLTFQPGTSSVSAVAQLSQEAAGNTLKVISDNGGTMAIQEYNSAGQPTQTAFVALQSNGAVAYNGETFVPFASVPAGQAVTVYAANGVVLGILYAPTA